MQAVLLKALTLAEPEGYIRTFVDEGDAMRQMILDLRSFQACTGGDKLSILDSPLRTYVDRLLSAFGDDTSALPQLDHAEKMKRAGEQIENPKSKICLSHSLTANSNYSSSWRPAFPTKRSLIG